MSDAAVDRNLLFGILALQNNFINREALLAAFTTWVVNKRRPLGEILTEQGKLTQLQDELLRALTEQHIKQHGNDPERSLAAVSSIDSIHDALRQLGDPNLEASLANVGQKSHGVDSDARNLESTGDWGVPGQRFRVLRPHARGGLGEVFVAQDVELHREVALKEIQSQFADHPDQRLRFVLEAEITGGLEHPGIVPVYGLGQYADGRPFYAMRFIRGDSLRDTITRFHAPVASPAKSPVQNVDYASVDFRKLLGRFLDVCEAIAYAHSRGVLHRDLKPGNIMLGKYGETLVVDWGLAKVLGRSEQASDSSEVMLHPSSGDSIDPTMMGKAIGTPAYMSPEQAAGRLKELGPASDVYSLGATLYALLTGQSPFSGDDKGDILRRVERGEFRPPRDVKPQVPAALQAICLKAMALKPADRYSSPKRLADDIEHWLADEPVTAWREPVMVRLRRWIRLHKTVATAAGTFIVAGLIAVVLFAGLSWQREQYLRSQIQTRIESAESANQEGNIDLALVHLAEAAGLSTATSELHGLHQEVQQRHDHLETFKVFTRDANELISRGIHGISGRNSRATDGQADPQLTLAETTLELYGALDDPAWDKRLDKGMLLPDQAADVRLLSADLLIMTAVRLALFDTNDDDGRARTRRALLLFDRAADLRDPTPGIWMLRMLWHRRLGDDDQASAAGETMTQLVKEKGRTAFNDMDHYLLGSVTLNILKQPAGAVGAYQSALARNPRHYGAALGLFFAHRELNDVPGQVMALRVAMALNPDEPDLYYFLGFAEFSRKNYEEALLTFRELTRRAPEHVQGHYWLGRCEIIAANYSEADNALTRSLELDPELPSPVSWRAVVRGHLPERYRDAVADAEAAVQHATVDDGDCWRAARAYALSVQSVLADTANPDRNEMAEAYGARAVQLLRDAVQRGFIKQASDIISIEQSTDLDAIRDRKDFQDMLAELKAKSE